jgi:transglutaminase-like putative cysteine protease
VEYYSDYWGNKTGTFNILAPHKILAIESRLLIETTSIVQPGISFPLISTGFVPATNDLQLHQLSNADVIKNKPAIDAIIKSISGTHKNVANITERCAEYIFKNFSYVKGITDIETTVDEILEHRSGVCQDFAHLMLQVLTTLKIPCRYVSGYICPNKNGLRGEGATHAWVDVYFPENGWVGIDPTNNIWVTNNHVKLAVGKHFKDCTPVKGTFKGPSRQYLSVYVSVGYEDGKIFEAVNNVSMELISSNEKENLIIPHSAGQQQQ